MLPEAAEQDCRVGTGPGVSTNKLTVVREQGLGDLREEEEGGKKERRETEKEKEEEIRRRRRRKKRRREGND